MQNPVAEQKTRKQDIKSPKKSPIKNGNQSNKEEDIETKAQDNEIINTNDESTTHHEVQLSQEELAEKEAKMKEIEGL